jgi:hypothetical protein
MALGVCQSFYVKQFSDLRKLSTLSTTNSIEGRACHLGLIRACFAAHETSFSLVLGDNNWHQSSSSIFHFELSRDTHLSRQISWHDINVTDLRINASKLSSKQRPGMRFTNCTKFLINNPADFLLAPLSGILPPACPLTWQNIPDNSRAIHQFY